MDANTDDSIEMVVAGLVLDATSNAPIVILKDPNSDASLPIWIGYAEASAIAISLKDVRTSRPMTHDLLKNSLDTLGAKIHSITISDLQDSTYIASIELILGDMIFEIDARPSDAVALALRYSSTIIVKKSILQYNAKQIGDEVFLEYSQAPDNKSNPGIEDSKPGSKNSFNLQDLPEDGIKAPIQSNSSITDSEVLDLEQSEYEIEVFSVKSNPILPSGELVTRSKEQWENLLKTFSPDDFKYKM